MTERVVFVDDDRFFARRYLAALEASYEVRYFDNASEGLEFLLANSVDVIILDVMMPPPVGFDSEITEGGLATGIWMRQFVEAAKSGSPTPTLLLTNRSPGDVRQQLETLDPDLVSKTHVRQKMDIRSCDLPKLIGTLLANTE